MINHKQKAKLRAIGNDVNTSLQIGKNGITPEVIKQASHILAAHEIMKAHILKTALLTPKEAAYKLCEALDAQIIQIIGNRFILYKPNKKKPVIFL